MVKKFKLIKCISVIVFIFCSFKYLNREIKDVEFMCLLRNDIVYFLGYDKISYEKICSYVLL